MDLEEDLQDHVEYEDEEEDEETWDTGLAEAAKQQAAARFDSASRKQRRTPNTRVLVPRAIPQESQEGMFQRRKGFR